MKKNAVAHFEIYADDPEKRPLLLWVIGDTSDHFAEHRAVIERML